MRRRIAVVAAGLLLLVSVPAYAAMMSPLLRWGLQSFETWFSKETPYELRIGAAQVRLPDGFALEDVSVREKKSVKPLLHLKELQVRLRLRSLLKRELIIENVTLVGPSLVIDTSAPSTSPNKKGSTGLGALKEIRHFDIRDARLLLKGETEMPLELSSISASGALEGDQLKLDAYSLALDSQTLTGNANVSISSSPVFDVHFVADRVSADRIARRFSTLPVHVQLIYTGDGRIRGNSAQWAVTSQGALAGGSVAIEFSRSRTQTLTCRFNRLGLSRFVLHSMVAPTTTVSGDLRAESALNWRSTARMTGAFGINGLMANQVRSNVSITGSVDLKNGRGQTAFAVKGDALAGNVDGAFDMRSGAIKAKFDMASPELQSLKPFYKPFVNWRGALTSSGTAAGYWKNPQVDALMRVTGFNNGAVSIAALQADAHSSGNASKRFVVDAAATDIRRSSQPANGWDLDSARLRWDGDLRSADVQAQAAFKNHTRLQGMGALTHDDSWRWRWSGLSYVFSDSQIWTADKGGTLEMSKDGAVTVSNLQISRENGLLALHHFLLSGKQFDVKADATHFPIDMTVALSSSSFPVRGTLDADISVDGSLSDPRGTFTLGFSSGAVNGTAFQHIAFEGNVAEETIQLRKGEIQTSVISEPARFEGTIPWDWVVSDAPDVSADVKLSFGPIDPAAWIRQIPHATVEAGGSIQFDGHVTGHRKNLVVEGSLVASLPRLKLPDYGLDLQDIAIDIQNKNEVFQIKQGSARMGKKGTIQLSGESHWPKIQIALSGKNIQFKVQRHIDFLGDADITLAGTLDEPIINGKISLHKGSYEVPTKKKKENAAPAAARTSYMESFWHRATMNVAGTWNRAVWYREGLTKIETQADAHVLKDRDTDQVYLTGTLSLVRGSYDAYGRDFVIKSGDLTFTGPPTVDASLQIDAEYKTVDVTVELQVSGTISQPIINLTSTPSMTQQEILSLLATGVSSVTGADLNGANSNATPGAGVAASVLSSYLTTQVRTSGLNFLALDVLRVTPTAAGNVWTVGRYLGPNLFFSYSANTKDVTNKVLNAEYTLSPRWSIVGQTGSNTDNYMDLQFRIPWARKKKAEPEKK